MTKKEQAEFDALRLERDMARALRWPEYAVAAPMTTDEIRAARDGVKQTIISRVKIS